MNNILIRKLFFIIALTFFSHSVLAKSIPPGTGEADIKNNILFMLDYSSDMNTCSGLSCADNRPNDVAIGYNGDIYVVGGYGGNLFRYNSAGTFQGTIKVKTSTSRMFGCGMDPTDTTDQFIYCADWSASWIAKICTGRVLDTVCTGSGNVIKKKSVSSPLDVAVHSSGDWLVSANCSGVRRYNFPNLSATSTYASTGCPDFITFDDNGSWYTTIWYQNNTQKWSGTNSFTKNWTNTSCRQSEMTAYSGGYLFVTERGYGKVCKIDTSTGNLTLRFGTGEGNGPLQFKQAWGGTTDPTSGNILIADTQNRRIQSMTTDGVFVSTFTTGDKTKLQIAKSAIKTIINDAEINESSRFGVMAFHYNEDNQKMFIPVSDQGKSDIATYFDTALSNPSGTLEGTLGAKVCSDYWKATDSTINIRSFHKTGSPTWSWEPQISPAQSNATGCQKNYVVFLLGSVTSSKVASAKAYITEMNSSPQNVKSFIVGIGSTIAASTSIHELAVAGETGPDETPANPKKPGVLFATNEAALVSTLRKALRSSVNSELTFASPTIDLDYSQGTEQTYVIQATFSYKEGGAWKGKLSKYEFENGVIAGSPVWKGHELLNNTLPTDRKMFSVEDAGGEMEVPIFNSDKSNTYADGTVKYLNNFHPANSSYLVDYMCDSNLCDERDIKNLINHARGWDPYDENQDCNGTFSSVNGPLAYDTETSSCIKQSRGTFINTQSNENTYKLFDIYHSKPLIVEPPSAPSFAFAEDSETKYRFINGYNNFKETQKNRKKIVLVGSNGGMLHSFNYSSGKEEWSFVPPSLLNKFESTLSARKITNVNESANISDSTTSITVLDASEFPETGVVRIDDEYIFYAGKTNASLSNLTRGAYSSTAATHLKDSVVINVSSKQSVTSSMYGVDGSPIVKDILTIDEGCGVPTWKTIAMVPLGRGGYSYTALDITNVDRPLHLFTIENDKTSNLSKTNLWHTVYSRENCNIYSSRTYKKTTTYQVPENLTSLVGDISNVATSLNVVDASIFNSDNCPQKCMITIDGEIITYSGISGNTLTGLARQDEANDNNPNSMNSSHGDGSSVRQQKSCGSNNSIDFNAVKQTIRYDYSALGQAWGRPDIYLLDTGVEGKKWVSILGAGYNGGADCHVGSAIYVLYMENFTSDNFGTYYNGSIAKKINIANF